MVKLISRQQAFDGCAALANVIAVYQYDELEDVSKDLTGKDLEDFKVLLDNIIPNHDMPIYSHRYKAGSENTGEIDLLVNEIIQLLAGLGSEEICIIPQKRLTWFFNEDLIERPDLYNEFTAMGMQKDFDGAIKVGLSSFGTVMKHVFNVSKLNATLPYIYFSSPGTNIAMSICQYGILHIDFHGELYKEVIEDSNLIEVLGPCGQVI